MVKLEVKEENEDENLELNAVSTSEVFQNQVIYFLRFIYYSFFCGYQHAENTQNAQISKILSF